MIVQREHRNGVPFVIVDKCIKLCYNLYKDVRIYVNQCEGVLVLIASEYLNNVEKEWITKLERRDEPVKEVLDIAFCKPFVVKDASIKLICHHVSSRPTQRGYSIDIDLSAEFKFKDVVHRFDKETVIIGQDDLCFDVRVNVLKVKHSFFRILLQNKKFDKCFASVGPDGILAFCKFIRQFTVDMDLEWIHALIRLAKKNAKKTETLTKLSHAVLEWLKEQGREPGYRDTDYMVYSKYTLVEYPTSMDEGIFFTKDGILDFSGRAYQRFQLFQQLSQK